VFFDLKKAPRNAPRLPRNSPQLHHDLPSKKTRQKRKTPNKSHLFTTSIFSSSNSEILSG
jgi:hypothetical protein